MNERWDTYFLHIALAVSAASKDPNTRVGAIIVGPDREIRATGFNGLPRGIADSAERLTDRDVKNSLIVHAEQNAILNAARVGTPVRGCTLYNVATDDSGAIWGGAPCSSHCTPALIQAGIAEVVTYPFKDGFSKWRDSIETARALLAEAGIAYREVAR